VIRRRLGIDIGGTFTDLVLVDQETKVLHQAKVLTTPGDPQGILRGLEELLEGTRVSPAAVGQLVHATTLISNALVERRGAVTALVTTQGFRDVLEIGREARYTLYDLFLPMPEPLVPRDLRLEVPERVGANGEVVRPLDPAAAEAVAGRLAAAGVESVAVCLLHSYLDPFHEHRMEQALRERHPGMAVSLSSAVSPEIREYERTVTTVANAYVQPLADRYLRSLAEGLRASRFAGGFHLMVSSGGLTSLADARAAPIRLLESGPAAGALVAARFAGLLARRRVVGFDMGGTTAKACLVEDGRPRVTYTFEAARQRRFQKGSGFELRIPSVELIEIGAGGGSIAHVDDLGLLKVGPQSAGADPGPACYGRGGRRPTVTDANLILGYYGEHSFLGGRMRVYREEAERAVGALAARLGTDTLSAAWGVHRVANEQMTAAVRVHLAEKGQDPRAFSLLATGGGGPCHGPAVARALGMREVLCPASAGVASALGLLLAPPRVDLARSQRVAVDEADPTFVEGMFARMEAQARALIGETGVAWDRVRRRRLADMRYVGQGFEITVELPPGPADGGYGQAMARAFERTYAEAFGRTVTGARAEAVTWRLEAIGPAPEHALGVIHAEGEPGPAGGGRQRPVFFPDWGERRPVPVLDRGLLAPGAAGRGPSVIEESASTAVVPPGAHWRVHESGTLCIDLGGEGV
jgi:5-oxoprolinase (ATP-hydrolysing)